MPLASSRSLIERFGRLKALVIGDLMLDHFIWGSVSRISPEAPVPVVQVTHENDMAGGAGNVAVNMAALGAEIFVIGVIGQDPSASRLLAKFEEARIRTECVVRTNDRPTIVKTRVIAQHQQVVRFDREKKAEFPSELQAALKIQIDRVLPQVNAVVFSDYAKGVISRAMVRALIPAANRRGIPITVDPKVENFNYYERATCITPNLKEAMEGAGVHSLKGDGDIDLIGQKILRKLKAKSLLITRGEKGMSLFERHRPPFHIPTRAREVFDVTGAGDTVISTFTLALAAGASLRRAAELANEAAGIVVAKLGTAYVTRAELLRALDKRRD